MINLKMVSVIAARENCEHYVGFFHNRGAACILSNFCKGTATDVILSCFGIEKREMALIQTFILAQDEEEIRRAMRTEMNINAAGNGVAIFSSLDSVGGMSAKNQLIGEEREVQRMENNILTDFVLIITITNKGYNQLVMDAAREAGARGGTVMKAHGTGSELTKFFGISITDEKEMVYIVAKREERENIMKAIMEKAGVNTEAHGVVFSIPVDAVEGINF